MECSVVGFFQIGIPGPQVRDAKPFSKVNVVTSKILGSTHSEKPCLALCLRLLSFKSDPLSAPACTDALFQAAARNPSDREAFNAMLLLTELSHAAYDAPKKFSGAYVIEALRQHRKARTHIRSSHTWLLSHFAHRMGRPGWRSTAALCLVSKLDLPLDI